MVDCQFPWFLRTFIMKASWMFCRYETICFWHADTILFSPHSKHLRLCTRYMDSWLKVKGDIMRQCHRHPTANSEIPIFRNFTNLPCSGTSIDIYFMHNELQTLALHMTTCFVTLHWSMDLNVTDPQLCQGSKWNLDGPSSWKPPLVWFFGHLAFIQKPYLIKFLRIK